MSISYQTPMLRAASRVVGTHVERTALSKIAQERLLSRLMWLNIEPTWFLDLGCGHGHMHQEIGQHWPTANCVAIDLCLPVLQQVQSMAVKSDNLCCADAEVLPIASGSMDVVMANLLVPWLPSHGQFLQECRRVLKPEGVLLFTSCGPDTLQELYQSWLFVYPEHHLQGFMDMHHLGDDLLTLGFSDPVVDHELLSVEYRSLRKLLLDLKAMGAYPLLQKRKGLRSRKSYHMLEAFYQKHFANQDNITATFELVYGYARQPKPKKTSGIEIPIKVEQA